jgi:hypothetical protein
VQKLPTKASAWAEVERQQIQINKPDFRKRVTFADLAEHYQQHELDERRSAIVDPVQAERLAFCPAHRGRRSDRPAASAGITRFLTSLRCNG